LNVRVSTSILVSGTVVGYDATPFGAEIPGADNTPMDAQVTLTRPGTITSASIATDDLGRFSLRVPQARGYQLSIVPRDEPTVPVLIESELSLVEDTDYEVIDLGYGEPIYGKVLYADGDPVEGALVRAVDPSTGVEGPSTSTDAQGHYMIRAQPGVLDVIVSGNPGTYLPTLTESVDITQEGGAHLSFDMGEITPVQVSGVVIDSDNGARHKDVNVQFRSVSLAEVDGDLHVDTETDGDGLFSRSILPGDWEVDFIPPFDSDLSPATMSFTVPEDQVTPIQLPDAILPVRVDYDAVIVDPSGTPIAGAVINAQERDFEGYIHSATANEKGRVQMNLPEVEMDVTLVPPSSTLALTQYQITPDRVEPDLEIKEGQPVSGVIRNEGEPVPFALVEIRDVDGTLLASTVSDPDGFFAVQIDSTY